MFTKSVGSVAHAVGTTGALRRPSPTSYLIPDGCDPFTSDALLNVTGRSGGPGGIG
jgi:hypothetical protein